MVSRVDAGFRGPNVACIEEGFCSHVTEIPHARRLMPTEEVRSKLRELQLQEPLEANRADELDARPLSHAAASTSGQAHDRATASQA